MTFRSSFNSLQSLGSRMVSWLFGRGQWTRSISFIVAVLLHIPLIMLGGRQYIQAASHPEGANQAVRGLKAMTNENGRPIKFIYVKDLKPSAEKPMDPTRYSDINRHGASPDPRKGESPDPTSMGQSPLRQAGGPGDAPFTRPSVRPSAASPKPVQPQPGQQGSPEARAAQAQREKGSIAKEVERAAREVSGEKNNGQTQGQPSSKSAKMGLPVGGEQEGGQRGQRQGGEAAPTVQPHQGQMGVGAQLQQMMAGAIQGGFNNPNASRLNTGDLSFDTAAWDLGPYARKVQERVQSNWRTPEAQMVLRQKGWVAIHFNVQKDGRVTDLEVVRSSGIPSYDQSAMDALRSSNPLPPLPDFVTVPQIGGLFRFYYNMPTED